MDTIEIVEVKEVAEELSLAELAQVSGGCGVASLG